MKLTATEMAEAEAKSASVSADKEKERKRAVTVNATPTLVQISTDDVMVNAASGNISENIPQKVPKNVTKSVRLSAPITPILSTLGDDPDSVVIPGKTKSAMKASSRVPLLAASVTASSALTEEKKTTKESKRTPSVATPTPTTHAAPAPANAISTSGSPNITTVSAENVQPDFVTANAVIGTPQILDPAVPTVSLSKGKTVDTPVTSTATATSVLTSKDAEHGPSGSSKAFFTTEKIKPFTGTSTSVNSNSKNKNSSNTTDSQSTTFSNGSASKGATSRSTPKAGRPRSAVGTSSDGGGDLNPPRPVTSASPSITSGRDSVSVPVKASALTSNSQAGNTSNGRSSALVDLTETTPSITSPNTSSSSSQAKKKTRKVPVSSISAAPVSTVSSSSATPKTGNDRTDVLPDAKKTKLIGLSPAEMLTEMRKEENARMLALKSPSATAVTPAIEKKPRERSKKRK